MKIRLINFSLSEPFFNMAVDEAVSERVRENKALPTFRFYGWSRPSITIGEFQQISELNMDFCQSQGIPVVRRPTGGKGIFHYEDITYSFSSRKEGVFNGNLFKSYSIIADLLHHAFNLSGVKVEIVREKRITNRSPLCFARSSFGEITLSGKKIVGSAQKRWRDGFLQQGTIPLRVNREILKKVFSVDNADSMVGVKEIIEDFQVERFIENFKIALERAGFQVVEANLAQEELELAQKFLLKYQSEEWLLGKPQLVGDSMRKRTQQEPLLYKHGQIE